jgi:hypothetical protein
MSRARKLLLVATFAVLAPVGVAWAYFAATSTPGGNGASAAASVNQGPTPTASTAGTSVTLTWSATTLSEGTAVNGYTITRYDAATLVPQTIAGTCAGTVTTTTCTETGVPPGTWVYSTTPVFGLNWRGAVSIKSGSTTVVPPDSTPPVNAVTMTVTSGGATKTGNTVYYRGAAAGSFTVTNAVSDSGSGPASSTTAALGGTSTGWTHSPSTVSTPAGGPYVSAPFGWAAATTSAPTDVVTGRDVAGNTAITTLSFVDDSTAPTGGTITYAAGSQTGQSVPVSFTASTDGSGSGVLSYRLQRAQAALSGDVCPAAGSFSAFYDIGQLNPTSPYDDTQVTTGTCYRYQLVVTDRVGNQQFATSANIAIIGYSGAVNSTSGLVSYWRLGEPATSLNATDSFTGTTASALTSHPADIGGTWLNLTGSVNTEKISSGGRAYRAGTGYSINYLPTTNPTANNSVEADLVTRSLLAGEKVGVVARLNTSLNQTYYLANWEASDSSWNLWKVVNGVGTVLQYVSAQPAMVANGTSRLRLTVAGNGTTTTLSLHVNGVLTVGPLTDTTASLQAPGKAGFMDGDFQNAATVTKSDTTGMHVENFQVAPSTYPRAVDSKGTNTGDHKNGEILGVAGALAGDPNTAGQFDGVNDHVQVTGSTGLPTGAAARSVEMWFKTTSTARQVLFDYGSLSQNAKFGLWIDTGGTAMTSWGWGGGSDFVFPLAAAVNNGAWHHVVQTYDGTLLKLYVDGVMLPAQAATRATVMDQFGFSIGASLNSLDQNYGGFFTGSIDEVSFYNTAITQATVTQHQQMGATAQTGPTGGSVDASGLVGTGSRYSTSTTLNVVLAKGTDPNGVAATGAQLQRSTATLTAGVCGTFGSYTQVSTDPTSPRTDVVTDQACYRYQYLVPDALGYYSTYTSPDVKVDSTAPTTPTLAFSALTNSFWNGTLYYRSGSGTFTTTASSTDTASGVASYAFPVLGTGWTSTAGALGVRTYSWTGVPAAPGTVGVTATNNATGTSAAAPFALVADDVAPSEGTVSYADGAGTATVSFTTGTDAGSGIGTRLLQRASATLTGGTCGTFGAFTTIATNPSSPFADTAPTGNCYQYRYVVSDNVGNQHTAVSANVLKLTSYLEAVNTTAGLTDYWRLAESATALVSSDSFSGAATTPITSHTGETGATWTHHGGTSTTEQISSENRLRRNGTGYSIDRASGTPSSQDYSVEADLTVKSFLDNDAAGVVGRLNTATNSFYLARWETDNTWNIVKWTNGTVSWLATSAVQPNLVAGQTHRIRLQMSGTTSTLLRLSVNGVQLLSATDSNSPFTAAGKAGIMDGDEGSSEIKTDSTGLHFDNFQVTPATYPRAANSKSGNTGDYVNGVTMSVPGAIVGDGNTAAQFDGVNDHVQVTGTTGIPAGSAVRSVEMWFKTSSAARQVLFNYGSLANTQEFGLWLNAGGASMTAWGSGGDKVFALSAAVNDGAWHQVVKTYNGTAITLYVDGVALAPQAATRATVMDTYGFGIGAVIATGATGSGGYFTGTLDEVSVYSTVLSQATISSHYSIGSATPP